MEQAWAAGRTSCPLEGAQEAHPRSSHVKNQAALPGVSALGAAGGGGGIAQPSGWSCREGGEFLNAATHCGGTVPRMAWV